MIFKSVIHFESSTHHNGLVECYVIKQGSLTLIKYNFSKTICTFRKFLQPIFDLMNRNSVTLNVSVGINTFTLEK